MNCKRGDLAIIIGGVFQKFLGRIITVTKISDSFSDCWNTDPPLYHDGFIVSMADEHLKPLRPGNEEDEMLRIAGKPISKPYAHKPASDLPA